MLARPAVIGFCLISFVPVLAFAGDPPEAPGWNGERVARRGNPRLFGPDYGTGQPARYNFMTVYKPQEGGINGRCGGGGGTRPMDPCKYFLDDYLKGSRQCVVAATQRNGGSASVYGCVGEASTMNRRYGRPVKICFADVYAGSQDPHRLKGRDRGKSKFDVAVRSRSPQQAKVTPRGDGIVTCKGRTPGSVNTLRRATRNPAAAAPLRRRG
jgi:hypothetical protein